MKRFRLTTLIVISLIGISSTKEEATSEKEVYDTREIVFYGYDYTHFRLADVKRLDEDLKKHVFYWIGFCQDRITEKKLRSVLDKEKVTFNFDPTLAVNKKLNSDDLGAITKVTISKDSIQSYINEYELSEKEGVGFVVILECFDNAGKRTSGYFTFFDIATKQVLKSDYVSSREGILSYNRVSDWGSAVVIAFEKYLDVYADNKKAYKRMGKR